MYCTGYTTDLDWNLEKKNFEKIVIIFIYIYKNKILTTPHFSSWKYMYRLYYFSRLELKKKNFV